MKFIFMFFIFIIRQLGNVNLVFFVIFFGEVVVFQYKVLGEGDKKLFMMELQKIGNKEFFDDFKM